MKMQSRIIAVIAVFSLLWISSEALSTEGYTGDVPSWMDPFANPRPVYKYDWAFGTGSAALAANGKWYDTRINEEVGKSRGDGVVYTEEEECYWTKALLAATPHPVNGFSLSNPIGDWIDAFDSGRAIIRYSIRQDLSSTNQVYNNDIVQIGDDEDEILIKRGSYVADSLGINPTDNITSLEWNVGFDDENLVYNHFRSINASYYIPSVEVGRNMDDETVYLTFGATADLEEDEFGNLILVGTTNIHRNWSGGNYFGNGTYQAHFADILYETRTYEPIRNADGPESPYEWVYDASGDMYVPTNGSGLPGDTPQERATKLIGNHPFWVNDDTPGECETDPEVPTNYDDDIWGNQEVAYYNEGGLVRGVFVDSWRLAGEMLGMEFWNSGYHWDPVDMRVEDGSGAAVAGYGELNDFMRYVFDIDALVVEDADGDNVFDTGDDYALFSVVDDGLYYKYQAWDYSSNKADVDTFFDGQYFDGDTIFLYDGTSVTTFFDAETGIFFGQPIDTATGSGTGQTLWAMYDIYDIEALDIGITNPEPATIALISAGLLGFAGVLRRKLR